MSPLFLEILCYTLVFSGFLLFAFGMVAIVSYSEAGLVEGENFIEKYAFMYRNITTPPEGNIAYPIFIGLMGKLLLAVFAALPFILTGLLTLTHTGRIILLAIATVILIYVAIKFVGDFLINLVEGAYKTSKKVKAVSKKLEEE
jgi:hypothetical protein